MKKRIISALTALFIIFSVSVTAFADGIRLFEEEHLPARDDLAFREIYREATCVCVSANYKVEHGIFNDLPKTAEEFGFEVLKPSYRDVYTLDERFDIYDDFLTRIDALDCEKLSLKNQFDCDFLKEYFETELMLRSVPRTEFGCLFTSAFEGITPVSDIWGIFSGEEEPSEQFIAELLEASRDYGDFVKEGCEHELKRLETGLAISAERIEAHIGDVSEILSLASDAPDNFYDFIDVWCEEGGLSEEKRAEYHEQFLDVTLNVVIPACELMLETLDTIKNAGTEPRGLCAFEGGEQYFRYLIRRHVGIRPDDLQRFYDDIYMKYDEESAEFYELCSTPERPAAFDEPYDYDLENMTDEELFGLWTSIAEKYYPEPVTTECEIEHYYSETDGAAARFVIGLYGDEHNKIRINDYASNDPTLIRATTIAHEGIPGHMYQYNMLMAQRDLLKFFFTLSARDNRFMSFTEGWACSGQTRMFDCIGANETQKYYYKAYMKYDTDCKYALWALMLTINGLTAAECCEQSGISPDAYNYDMYVNMFGRFLDDPVYYLAYFIGEDAFDNAYDRAREALGGDFDEIEYNRFIMDLGVCDMDALEKWEGVWIDKVLAAHAEAPEVPENPEVPEIPETPAEPETPENPPTGIDLSFAIFGAALSAAVIITALKKENRS